MFQGFFKSHTFFLLLIIFAAILLRTYQLGSVPPSPDWDEAALGYNAYSILQTGKDEYGKVLPVVLRSFDDYKPALYTYLIIPMIVLFDLNTVAVRLPSAIMGVFAVLLTYLLVKELLDATTKTRKNLYSAIPLLAAALLAISPWHIQFSRVAFEANVGVTLNIAFVYFFLRGLKNPLWFSVSMACAALSIYTYQSEKLFVPLVVVALIIIYFKQLIISPKKYLIIALLSGAIVIFPMVHFIATDDNALRRAQATSIFSNNQELLKPSVERLVKAKEKNDIIGIISNNRRIVYAQTMVSNYFVHFSPLWLFINGDIERHHAPQMGLLYLWEFPFLVIGFIVLGLKKFHFFDKRGKLLILSWFFLAPIPAAFTHDVPHAVRTLNALPTFQILTAVGIVGSILFLSLAFKKRYSFIPRIILSVVVLCIIANGTYYLQQYFIKQNVQYSESWQYGYEEAVTFASGNSSEYSRIIVTNTNPLDQSYIFFLYYLKYPPQKYQQEQNEKKSFSKYEFRPLVWEKDIQLKNSLLVGTPAEFPPGVKPLKVVNYLNDKPAIYFVNSQN